jgi:hypothetical protein
MILWIYKYLTYRSQYQNQYHANWTKNPFSTFIFSPLLSIDCFKLFSTTDKYADGRLFFTRILHAKLSKDYPWCIQLYFNCQNWFFERRIIICSTFVRVILHFSLLKLKEFCPIRHIFRIPSFFKCFAHLSWMISLLHSFNRRFRILDLWSIRNIDFSRNIRWMESTFLETFIFSLFDWCLEYWLGG